MNPPRGRDRPPAVAGSGAVPSGSLHRRSDGRFRNPWPGDLRHGFLQFLRWSFSRRKLEALFERRDPDLFSTTGPTPPRPRAADGELAVTWLGHASALLQLGPVNVLTDPIWSRRASPVGFAGPLRWVPPPLDLSELPPLDLVLVSHDHYDHLDADTVRRLVRLQPAARWIVPLGVAELLSRWGVRRARELDWWEDVRQEVRGAPVRVTCTPARHFASRGLFDRNRRLWCGWSMEAGGRRVYFAGDTGYHPEFGAIGGRLGPFDAALLPIGAYEPRWFMRPVHMSPEEAVQAWHDLSAGKEERAGALVPVHWGTFRLTDEPMEDPPARLRRAWDDARAPGSLWLLQHGETRRLPPGSRTGAAGAGAVGP
ncbi:MAG: MBL fold metallo-hydrolase [Candidatus Palauibacterales bacterium]|nr:MBL fold metallo-hydrolase [Candidatus Palauibacterales bacterium]MDP2583816.1 MBL fold metallo-hydrolase [Candidatus Palauibacterales bacterium]